MTDGPVLYAEPGSTRWPLLWGPAFAGIGAGTEALSGRVHTVAWLIVGIMLFGVFALWVNVRRKVYRVELTPTELLQGRETLPIKDIAQVTDAGTAPGAKILGGGWSVPRKTYEIPLRLDDGSTVLAWARDDDALKAALARLVGEEVGED